MSSTFTFTFALLSLMLVVLCQSRSIDENSNSYDQEAAPGGFSLAIDGEWPRSDVKLGQIGGVGYRTDGNAVIFHRGSRTWEDDDFDDDGAYTKASRGKVKEDTLAVIDKDGNLVESWGADMFFMPHGLTVDHENNLWVTDVAAQQVFKFAASDKKKPALTLGEFLKPGFDSAHFCQPTDVAVASNGDFFVADGYCNSRIIKFDRNGKFLVEFGTPADEAGDLSVPHSLALIEEEDTICVADRENERIQCFDAGLKNASRTGTFNGLLAYREINRIFAIAYDKTDSMIHGLSVSESESFGFSIATNDPEMPISAIWAPRDGFNGPHDIAISPDGKKILVGQLGKKHLQLFRKVY